MHYLYLYPFPLQPSSFILPPFPFSLFPIPYSLAPRPSPLYLGKRFEYEKLTAKTILSQTELHWFE